MSQYIAELDNKLHFARMGFSLGLGAIPKEILEGQLETVTMKIMNNGVMFDNTVGFKITYKKCFKY